jgi:hypothetical protein
VLVGTLVAEPELVEVKVMVGVAVLVGVLVKVLLDVLEGVGVAAAPTVSQPLRVPPVPSGMIKPLPFPPVQTVSMVPEAEEDKTYTILTDWEARQRGDPVKVTLEILEVATNDPPAQN